MRYLSNYSIAFKGLKEGNHTFEYEISNRFFEEFENSQVTVGEIKAKVLLIKQSTILTIKMQVDGLVELACDRCLENYNQTVSGETKLFVKFGEEFEDSGDEIITLPFEEYQINIAQYLYELIVLSIPIKHVHPDDEEGNSTCNPQMLDRIDGFVSSDEEEEDEPIDERWNELKKLLDNKKNN